MHLAPCLLQHRMFSFCNPMSPHVLVDFVVLPPGHGRSVTSFWSWDAYEAQLRCPDDVSGDIGGCSARRALKHKFYQPTQTIVTVEIEPGTSWLVVRDHEAGRDTECLWVCFDSHNKRVFL